MLARAPDELTPRSIGTGAPIVLGPVTKMHDRQLRDHFDESSDRTIRDEHIVFFPS